MQRLPLKTSHSPESEILVTFLCPSVGAHFKDSQSLKLFFSCVVVFVVVVKPSNLTPCYRTLFPCDSDGDANVDYCFWEVSLASFFFLFHKQIICNHWQMRAQHAATLLWISCIVIRGVTVLSLCGGLT